MHKSTSGRFANHDPHASDATPDRRLICAQVFGNTVFFALAQSMMLRAMILIDSWNWLGGFCAWFQYVMLYSFTLFMAQAGPYGSRPYDMNSFISYDFYGVAYRCFGSGVFWLVALILVPVACAALQLSIKIVHLEWFPDVQRRV